MNNKPSEAAALNERPYTEQERDIIPSAQPDLAPLQRRGNASGMRWRGIFNSLLARGARPETVFWWLGLILGLFFLVLTPPFQAPDEVAHFYHAYQVADGQLRAVRVGDTGIGAELPRSLKASADAVMGNIAFHAQEKQSVDKIVSKLTAPLNPQDRAFTDFRTVALYSPLPYLPQAVGFRLGMLFHLSPILLLYVGRLGNLLVAVLLTGLAIRLLPLMKWGLLLLAFTPMTVFQRSSLSADALLNALAFVFIALVVRAAWPRTGRLTRGEVIVLGLTALTLGLCKPPYYPLSLLCLLIPSARFGGTKQYLAMMVGILGAAALALVLWITAVRGLYLPTYGAPNTMAALAAGADPNHVIGDQVRFLLQHPLHVAFVYWNTAKRYGYDYYLSFIGVLGWLDTFLPFKLYYAYPCVLLMVALVDGDRQRSIGTRARLWMLLVFMLSLAVLGGSIYVQWTPTGAAFIEGLQGRYFIPLSPLLLLPLCFRRGAIDLSANGLHWFVIGFVIWAMCTTLHALSHRYYLTPAN